MKTIAVIVAVTVVALVAFSLAGSFISETTGETASSLSAGNALSYTIAGAVNRPGTYVLKSGAVLQDLIGAADGVTTNADSLAYNVDYVLKAKGTYYIAPVYDNSDTCASTPIRKANINKASESDLVEIGGFGKAAASSLVNYRATHSFSAIEEIKDVSGIGDATFRAVRDRITLKDAAS